MNPDRAVGARTSLLAVALVAAALLGACASSTGPAAPPPEPVKAVAPPPDANEIERRARVRLELAGAYFANGQLDTALDEVKRSIATKSDLAEAYRLRGMIYASQQENRLAEESFDRALQINPKDGGTLHVHGLFLCNQGRFAPAQAQFAAALAIPQYRDASRTYLARGVCHGRNQQWPEAETALMRAYELEPANPSIGVNLAEVLMQRGAYERARFYIGRVNDVPDSVNAQTLWLAARIERKLGQESTVRVLGQRLRQGYPQSPEAALFERGRFDD